MADENEKAIFDVTNDGVEDISLNDLEQSLQTELDEQFEDLEFLKEERERINDPENLGETVMNVVWDQFLNQIAITAGEDFIKENHGLHLDLSKEAHIQTTENFASGKIATHNTKIDYQKRYDDWQSNFVKDENGETVTHTTRAGKEEATLVKGARKPFDDGRPSGSAEKHTDMDHTVSAAEIIRDPAANAHMTKEEQIAFANSDANLNEMDSSLNRSKGDKSTTDWLDNPNAKGQKPDEIFDISKEEEQKMRQKDAEAREEYERQKKEAEERSIKAGKQSQKEEFFRISGKALRTAVITALATLVKKIISKLVLWFKSAERTLSTLIDSVKEAILSFVRDLKNLIVNTASSVFTTIATSIVGPVVGVIKKVVPLLKQGWSSLKEAVQYLRKPENRGRSLKYLIPEVGKIVIAGLTGIGSIVLSEFIEKALMSVPFLAVEIPLFGSLANIIGIFMGAVVCGIIGAIAINLINKLVERNQKRDNLDSQIDKKNEILNTQNQLIAVNKERVKRAKGQMAQSVMNTHRQANEIMEKSLTAIYSDDGDEDEISDRLDQIDSDLNDLLD